MTTLLETPLPVAVVGGLLALTALLVFLSRRTSGSLAALAIVVAITAGLILAERLVVTDREQIETATHGLADAIQANSVTGVLAYMAPDAAKIRGDVEALMPQVKWSLANAGSLEVTLNEGVDPPTATSQFRAFLQGVHSRSGMPVAYLNQRVDMQWVKQGDHWLMESYTAYYDDQPIDAAGSAAANRPVR
jgi:hypothetical protein